MKIQSIDYLPTDSPALSFSWSARPLRQDPNLFQRRGIGWEFHPARRPLVRAQHVRDDIRGFLRLQLSGIIGWHRLADFREQVRNGHPVVFSRTVFDELRRADPAIGAKAVLRDHQDAIVNVDVDDPGVAGDIDTPEDYEGLGVKA